MFEVDDRNLNMKWLISEKKYPMFEVFDRILNMKRLMSEKEYLMFEVLDCMLNIKCQDCILKSGYKKRGHLNFAIETTSIS